jgi:chromosome segregation ATPase
LRCTIKWWIKPYRSSFSRFSQHSAILMVAREICRVDDGEVIDLMHPNELWEIILSMTNRSNKRKSFEPPPMDTPHMWDNQKKHDALASLLDGAVTHKSIDQRKIYIERIMALNETTQQSLMALIERRKKKTFLKSPAKNKLEGSSTKKRTKTESISRPARETLSTPPQKSKNQYANSGCKSPIPTPASQLKATPNGYMQKQQRRGLFATPQHTVDNGSPRRTIDKAFGSSPSIHDMTSPSPKRLEGGHVPFFSPGLGDSAVFLKELQELREENRKLATDLGSTRKREEELTQQVENVETRLIKEMMKIEKEARLREDEARDAHKNEVAQLQSDIRSLSERYEHAERAEEELAGVKEEMELMLHTKGMLADTTEKLRKYRERLSQYSDVKDALKREEEAHSQSVEQCLRLENELKTLQPVKRQLEEYKTRAVDAEVRFAESQDELRKLKQEKLNLENMNEALVKGKISQQEEVEEVHRRIQEEDKEKKEALGVGVGLSELNPELKEEVLRLRNENGQLRAFAAKREADAVQQMEQDLEDASRLSERYKGQFLSTKGNLETTQADLRESQTREANLKTDVAEWTQKAKGSQERANQLSVQLHKCSDDLMNTRTRVTCLEKEVKELFDQAKASNERCVELSERLTTCNTELDASRKRETNLKNDVSDWIQQSKASQERANELSEQLHKQSVELNKIRGIEASLNTEVAEWTKQAKSSQERANELSEQLHICSTELNATRIREAALVGELADSQEQVLRLADQLNRQTNEHEKTRSKLADNQELERGLRNDLADMTGRVLDCEAVSKQRMEMLQNTRDKLTGSQGEVENLKQSVEGLELDVTKWTQKANDADAHNREVEKELADVRLIVSETQHKLQHEQEKVAWLQETKSVLETDLSSWKEKALTSESLTEKLQNELVQTREILMKTQTSLKQSRDNEETSRSNVIESDKRVHELEASLERAIKSRQDAISQLRKEVETTRADQIAKAEKDLRLVEAKFSAQLNEEVSLGLKQKQELFHAQEVINTAQISLAESQSREKMLKQSIEVLEESRMQLEAELKESEARTAKVIQESTNMLDATREAGRVEAKKQADDLKKNMNQLLEDERRAKRQVDEMNKETLRQHQVEWAAKISEVQEQAADELKAAKIDAEQRLQAVQSEWGQRMELVEKQAAEKNEKLISRGKGMLNDVRIKAKNEIQTLEDEFSVLKEQFSAVRLEKEAIAAAYKSKVSEYKKQLQFSTGRVNSLTNEADELEEKVKNLEREKFRLQEENDRYRRQLGGRFGSDAKVQNQLDLLQKEFKSVLNESRELKRKLNEQGLHMQRADNGMLAAIDENGESFEKSYSRDAVSQSSLVQLRAEYEATLEALNDEKRELVMKNSAAITDVQKAEQRAWEADQVNSSLKHELTSLKLHNERLEHELASTRDSEEIGGSQGSGGRGGSHQNESENQMTYSSIGNANVEKEAKASAVLHSSDDWESDCVAFDKSKSSSQGTSDDENTVPTSEKSKKLLKSHPDDDWERYSPIPNTTIAFAKRTTGGDTGNLGVLSSSQTHVTVNSQRKTTAVSKLAKPRSENQNAPSFVELMAKSSPGRVDRPSECTQS